MIAMMAPVSISPAGSIGFLEVLAQNSLLDDLTCSTGQRWVSAADCANGLHHALAECRLLGIVVGVAVAAVREPVGGDPVEQSRQGCAFKSSFLFEFGLSVGRE